MNNFNIPSNQNNFSRLSTFVFWGLISFCLFFINSPVFAQLTGTSCSNPKIQQVDSFCVLDFNSVLANQSDYWISFTATSKRIQFNTSVNGVSPNITSIELIQGSCTNLQTLEIDSVYTIGDSISFDTNLDIGQTYLLKFNLSSTFSSSFDACLTQKSLQNGIFIFTDQNGNTQTCSWTDFVPNSILDGDSVWGQMYHCDLNFCVTDTVCVTLLINNVDSVPIFTADFDFVYAFGNQFNSINYNSNFTEACFTFNSTGVTTVYAANGYSSNTGNSLVFPYTNVFSNNNGSGTVWGWSGDCEYYMDLNVFDETPPGTYNTNSTICSNEVVSLTAYPGTTLTDLEVNGVGQQLSDSTQWSTSFGSPGTYVISYTVEGLCKPATYVDTVIVIDSTYISVTIDGCNQATFNLQTCIDYDQILFYDGINSSSVIIPINGFYSWTVNYSGITLPVNWTLNCLDQLVPTLPTLSVVYSESQTIQPVTPNPIYTDAPTHLCDLTEGGISIVSPIGLSNLVWTTSPSTATFSGQGTTTIFPDSWSVTADDITVSVSASDSNGCFYSTSFILKVCCEPDTVGIEYFEGIYTYDGSHSMAYQLPSGYYNGPTQSIIIDLPIPVNSSISTMYSAPTTLTQFVIDNPGVYDSQNSIISTSEWLFFNNDLIIDRDVTFSYCHFMRFAPGARMIIQPNVTVNIIRSTLAPKCYEMWGGIDLSDETQQLILNDVSVIGAISGIYSSNGAYYQVSNSRFIDNYHGIKVTDYSLYPTLSTVISSYFGDVKDQPLLPPYQLENQPVAGVYIEDIFSITVGTSSETGNLFHNHQKGIQSLRSSVTSLKNNFHNIRHIPSDPIQNEGDKYCALYSSNSTSPLYAFQNFTLIVGGTALDRNNFLNCEFGVSSKKAMNLTAKFNFFKNCLLRGISAEENRMKSILIESNEINSTNSNAWGIYVKNYSNGVATITSNKINTNNVNFSNINRFAAGIYVASVQPTVPQSTLIRANIIHNCLYGIWMLNISNGVIDYNTVKINLSDAQINTLSQNYAPFRGIHVQNSIKAQIINNKVSRTLGTGNGVINDNLQAIRLELSPGARVKQNIMEHTAVGFYAFGSSLGSRIECNQMYYTRNGFYLNDADLSDQGAPIGVNNLNGFDAHNEWYYAFGDRTDGSSSLTNYYHGQNGSLYSIPSSTLNNYWNDIVLTSNPPNNCAQSKDSSILVMSPEERTRELESIVENTIQYDTLDYQQKYYLNLATYSRLESDTSLLIMNTPDDSIYIDYYQTHNTQNTPCKLVHDVQLAMADGDYETALLLNNQLMLSCNLYATNKSVQELWSQRKLDSLDFTSLDSITLLDIACLNPLEFGSGVYQARAMMDWDGFCVFVNKSIQLSHGRQETMTNLSVIYPNPSKSEISIESIETIDLVSIYDSRGVLIKSLTTGNDNKLNVYLLPGVYTIHLMLSNGKLESHKVVIL
jgi:hypothetical protein